MRNAGLREGSLLNGFGEGSGELGELLRSRREKGVRGYEWAQQEDRWKETAGAVVKCF